MAKKPAYKGAAAGHGPCRSLTPDEIAELSPNIRPPLTAEQLSEKQRRDANVPDNSHLTVWAP